MNAIQITETLRQNFVRYLLTTFDVEQSDAVLAGALRRKLESPGVLFRGPFLELNPPYAPGCSLRALVEEGVLNKAVCQLQEHIAPASERPLPPDRPLYRHQEAAIRRILGKDRNIVVASGTGSGKTECFLIPILHDLLSDPAPGVRALLIYPMNALVNDQLDRLRKLLAGTGITFGRYTSELKERESEGKKVNPHAPENEIVSRERIRGDAARGLSPNPPQILITNYAMLEYLLLRPEDSPIFDTSRLRFLCLDEAHTYSGAQGIEVSMLLRRLKQRLGKRSGEVRCIATSATLTEDDRGAAARFASNLFGEPFFEEDVIFGTPLDLSSIEAPLEPAPSAESWLKISDAIWTRLRNAPDPEDDERILIRDAAREFEHCGVATPDRIAEALRHVETGGIAKFLWSVFHTNSHLAQLRVMMRETPLELNEAGRELFGEENPPQDTEEEAARADAVCRLVEIGAMARQTPDSVPLLPARYHLFARSPQGAWLCLNRNCDDPEGAEGWSHLYLEKRQHCPSCKSAVYELTACRNCGQPYVRAFYREGKFATEGRFEGDDSGQRYFVWAPLTPEGNASENENADDSSASAETRPIDICLGCHHPVAKCACGSESHHVTLYQIQDAKGNPKEAISSCPRCSARGAAGREVVTSIKVGSSAPLAVLTEELYRLSPPSSQPEARKKSGEGRKLLSFADSRQGAARYAAYLQSTADSSLYRHLIAQAASDLAQKGQVPDVEELAGQCGRLAEKYGLYGELPGLVTDAERRRRQTDAAKRILAEFCSLTDRRHSLWSLGLVGCDVHFPADALPDEALCSRFGLAPAEMMTVIQALLDTMRQDKAVTMPDGIRADDEVFGPSPATIYYRLTRSLTENKKPYVNDWVSPKEQFARMQARFDYVLRIHRARNKGTEISDVQDALAKIWSWLQDHRVFISSQTGEAQIDYRRLIFPVTASWHQCNRCLRISSRYLSDELPICPSRGCEGRLEPYEPQTTETEDHYLALFRRTPIAMRVEEHTAQLQPQAGRQYQEGFIQGDINVLSCSTTFEMGVDVGDLQTVVLSNVPPSVANYRQRAGRAGRRASGAAFILTYAAPRPHDRVYFSDPTRIIAGEVAVPHLGIGNGIITSRHLNATLLGHFLRWLARLGRQELLQSGAFFAPNSPDGRHADFLGPWREECQAELVQVIQKFSEENWDVPLGTPDVCLNNLENSLKDRCRAFERWLSEYERLRDEATQVANSSRDRSERGAAEESRKRFNAFRDRLLSESLIDFLCREGILPSYSFPIDLVSLQLPLGRAYRAGYANDWLRLERDKKIAIVEYAPGAEVVADKHLWKSVGVTIREQLNEYEYRICEICRHLQRSEQGGLPIEGVCRVCGASSPGIAYNYIDPDGFTTDLTANLRKAGLQVERGINRSRSFLLASGQNVAEEVIAANDQPLIHYAYRRDGELVSINSGADPEGFRICKKCGIQRPSSRQQRGRGKQGNQGHETPRGEKGCMGETAQFHLGHAFKSDTLHLRFESNRNITVPPGGNLSFWRSLTYALLEGASLALQIERRDLDGVVRPFNVNATETPEENFSQEIVLFDNVPGGAGHVRQIVEKLEAVLRKALEVAQCTECEEETSCPSCLRNYGNQIYWEELKRGPVARFLESVIHEAYPDHLDHLARGAARVAAIDRPRWISQQLLAAEERVLIAVDEVSRDRLTGTSLSWLEIVQELLRRRIDTTLFLPALPPADRKNVDVAGLRNHLSLLVREGLRLHLLERGARPAWNLVIDPSGNRCRAISIEGEEQKLGSKTGDHGLVTTLDAVAVGAIAGDLQRLFSKIVKPEDLEFPPNVRVRHVRNGERLKEADLFKDVFRLQLKSLLISDRYLRSKHHENRIRAYLELIVCPPGVRPQITIETLAAEVQLTQKNFYFQRSQEQRGMFERLSREFPALEIRYTLVQNLQELPHDRFLLLSREDGTTARIAIGAGLDFIRYRGETCMTDIIIEDPYSDSE